MYGFFVCEWVFADDISLNGKIFQKHLHHLQRFLGLRCFLMSEMSVKFFFWRVINQWRLDFGTGVKHWTKQIVGYESNDQWSSLDSSKVLIWQGHNAQTAK